jgi:anti-anti-sigma factor
MDEVQGALQREVLPGGVPVVPGARIAACYRAGDDGAAGGDFFDAYVRPGGSLALVVGDVAVKGVAASAAAGRLRAVLQDRLDGDADPVEAMTAVNRLAQRVTAAYGTTLCLAVMDPADGTVDYCTAGSPPPLIATPDGSTGFLPATGGLPLGADGGAFPVRRARLGSGDLLVLYTDGVLKRPELTFAEAQAVFAGEAGGFRGSSNELAGLLPAAAWDDAVVLAVRRQEVPPELDLVLPAVPLSLRRARTALAAWLGHAGAGEEDAFTLQHAIGELVTNAVEHGSAGPGSDTVRLTARLDAAGAVEAVVRDRGVWREPARQSLRGRGLALTSQLVGSLTVVRGDTGTTAAVRHPLTGEALILDGSEPRAVSPEKPPAEPMLITDDGAGRVRVTGAVDATSATSLRQDLLRRGRGGNLRLTVELSGVTYLSSAGIATLHHVRGQYERQGTPLELLVAGDAAVRAILDVSGLAHRVSGPAQGVTGYGGIPGPAGL